MLIKKHAERMEFLFALYETDHRAAVAGGEEGEKARVKIGLNLRTLRIGLACLPL